MENCGKMDVLDSCGVVVFLWWRGFVVVFLWCCFCGGVLVVVFGFLCWCGSVFVVVFLWWCFCGGGVVVFLCVLFVCVVVFLWWCFCLWCFCGGVVVSAKTAQSSAEVMAVFKDCHQRLPTKVPPK